MYAVALLTVAALVGSPTSIPDKLAGSFKCSYEESWGCGPASTGPFCVDAGRDPNAGRYVLRVDFESGRIRLNNLGGHIEKQKDGYGVFWDVRGLGPAKLSRGYGDDRLALIELSNRGGSRSEFKCERSKRATL